MADSVSNPNKSVLEILRTVPNENAFYFYKGEGSPSGPKAASLREFLSEIESAEPETVFYHSQRHDFENWVRMLGDPTLAKQMQTISSQNLTAVEVKSRLVRIVRMRVGKLRKLAHEA
jgi:hypothetical protein